MREFQYVPLHGLFIWDNEKWEKISVDSARSLFTKEVRYFWPTDKVT